MMRILRAGSQGDDVSSWQNFLRGINPSSFVVVNSMFDQTTLQETVQFQKHVSVVADGVVGPGTFGKAFQLGYCPMSDDSSSEDSDSWPVKPQVVSSLSTNQADSMFGKFQYMPAPTQNNPEAITIIGDWAQKNIITIEIPQLVSVLPSKRVQCHQLISSQMTSLFAHWESAGLIPKIMSWGGSWAPRFKRGSRSSLSNHAWGTAFDINVPWNMLGTRPALKNQVGSVRELVSIAVDDGFFWGGWFSNRRDGMHFEAFEIKGAQ